MAITNQQTLRDTIEDWLNRADLTDNQIDSFISAGESKIYDVLKIPPLETSTDFTLTESVSTITIPSDFIEAIEIRKVSSDGTSSTNDTVLKRTEPRNVYDSSRESCSNSFARDIDEFVITGSAGNLVNDGTYKLKYYRYLPAIGAFYDNGSVFETDQTTCDALSSSTYDVSTGECTITAADVEIITYLISGEPDLILYSSLVVASDFLNDDEGSMRYNKLFFEKMDAVTRRAHRAEMSGGNIIIKLPSGIG